MDQAVVQGEEFSEMSKWQSIWRSEMMQHEWLHGAWQMQLVRDGDGYYGSYYFARNVVARSSGK